MRPGPSALLLLLALAPACGGRASPGDPSRPDGGSGSGGGGSGGGGSGSGGSVRVDGGNDGGVMFGDAATPGPPLPCFAGPAAAGGEAVVRLEAQASRTTGVAPLAVFFDTSGTTADGATRPFHDLAYCWSFGDPDSGSFATTGRSKNQARGPVAGHVFETPGTFTVTVAARDAGNREATRAITVTVQDPDAAFSGASTRCFSSTGDFTGCPAGAQQNTASTLSALQAHVGTGRRLLLRRGDTFTRDAAISIVAPGPGLIGAFGTGSRPIITTNDVVFQIADRDRFAPDWRMADLRFEDSDGATRLIDIGGASRTAAADLLFLRLAFQGGGTAIVANLSIYGNSSDDGHPNDIPDGVTIQDSELGRLDGYFLYVSARRFLMQGNRLVDDRNNSNDTDSLQRFHWLERGVMSDNELGPGAGVEGHAIYLHGPGFSGAEDYVGGLPGLQEYTDRVVISGNIIRDSVAAGNGTWLLQVAPQNPTSDERFRDVIVERNLFLMGQRPQGVSLGGDLRDVSVRENLFVGRGNETTCVLLHRRGPLAASPVDVVVSHNSCAGERQGFLISLDPGTERISARNNLVVGPARGLGGALGGESGNRLLVPADAQLGAWPPATWQDFRPTNAASVAGDPQYRGFWDYSGNQRVDAPEAGGLEAGGP